MSDHERALQDKLIAELQWWSERSKRDYKGNPPPFEKRKSRQSVEEEQQKIKAKLAADSNFLPFWHGRKNLVEDAVTLRHLHGSHYNNPQAISTAGYRTTRSEGVADCLNWTSNNKRAAQMKPEKHYKRLQPSSPIWDSHSINCMTPAERATAYREIILKHPKLKPESLRVLHERWNRESQLKETFLQALSFF